MEEKQTNPDKVAKIRAPKDYESEFNTARYISTAGWDGVSAGAIRNAMIGAIRYVKGLAMTDARGLVFIIAEGFDRLDGTPLVRIRGCKASHDTRPVRLESGVADLRNRPRYDGWYAEIVVEFDADMISATDVANLLNRAGRQVGLCEGRPGSKKSNGIGFGTFAVEGSKTKMNPKVH